MKRTIKLAVAAAVALTATSAFATNGATMIGMGAKTCAMGGTGIGVSHGAESTLSNPALITKIKSNNEVSFGGTLFLPDVSTRTTGSESSKSEADMFVIPSVSVASKVNDNFYFGVGMWGTGGLGVDYRNSTNPKLMEMTTSLQLMQFGVPLAYTADGFSVGITPIIQYGALDINYNNAGTNTGTGVASDLSVGYNLGLAYETNGLTVGAVYVSKIDMDFTDSLSSAVGPMTGSSYTNNTLSSPAQYGVGASYKMGEHTLAVDYKRILWSDAGTYQDFSWADQNVVAIGYEYAASGWALRAGYQYAKSAVQDRVNATTLQGPADLGNTFNLLGFPGTEETHITAGGTIALNKMLSLDVTVVKGLANEQTAGYFNGVDDITTKHSEMSYSAQLNYNF